jgi:hypothetical protein
MCPDFFPGDLQILACRAERDKRPSCENAIEHCYSLLADIVRAALYTVVES